MAAQRPDSAIDSRPPETSPPANPAAGSPGLRKDCLSPIENVAQTLGTMAPSGTLGVIIPLVAAKSGTKDCRNAALEWWSTGTDRS